MKDFTKTAKERLDGYLNQVRRYLAACKSVDCDEIICEVSGHIELELATVAEPVSFDAVDEILNRLGSPQQWVPEDEISWWRKMLLQLQHGPDDWRLAYISFGLLVLALLFFPLGGLLLLPLSFFLARAAMSISDDPTELGPQRYLLYPSLIIVYATVAILLLAGPAFILLGAVDGLERNITTSNEHIRHGLDYWWWAWDIIFFVTGLWWIALSAITAVSKRFFEFVFKPFLSHSNKIKLAKIILIMGLILTLLAVAIGWTLGGAGGPIALLHQCGLM